MIDLSAITSARDRFELLPQAVKRLNEIKLLIMYDCDDWKPLSVRSHSETSDPTASRAIYAVDELGEKLASLRQEESELEEFIGLSLAILEAVREGFGEIYALLLERRYIDEWKWADIYETYRIKRQKGNYLIDIACDWIDSVGVSRLLRGDNEL